MYLCRCLTKNLPSFQENLVLPAILICRLTTARHSRSSYYQTECDAKRTEVSDVIESATWEFHGSGNQRDARCAIRVRLARQKGGKPFGLVRRKKNPPRRKRMEKKLEPRRPSIFARKAHRRIPWTQAGRLRPRINHGKGREKKAVLSLPRFSLDLLLPDRNLVAWDTGQRKG